MSDPKKVVAHLPGMAKGANFAERYELEFEILDPIGTKLIESESPRNSDQPKGCTHGKI